MENEKIVVDEPKITEEFRNGIYYYYGENHELLMTSLNKLNFKV